MELYMLGRLALPVVIAIIGVAGGVVLFSGLIVLLRLLVVLRHNIMRRQEKRRSAFRVLVTMAPRPALNPPMQEQD